MKRGKLEIIRDILTIIRDNHNSIRITPLLRQTNISSSSFKEYFNEITKKGFITQAIDKRNHKTISLTEKGFRFIEKYKTIINFIDEFEL